MWATQRSPLQDVRRRLSGGEIVTTMHVMYTVAGGRDEAGSKVRGDVLAPEVLARVREVEAEIVAFSADHVTRLDSAVPCLLGRKSAAAEAGGALAWYAAEDAGEPSQANVVSCVYGLLAAAEGSDHFGTDLDASMRGGANMTCPALRSSLTFRGAPDQAWARRLIWRLYAISGGGGVEVSFRGDGGWFWAEFEANLTRDVGFVAVSLAFIWLFTASVLRMPVYATAALAVVVASFPVAFAFYSGPLGAEKAPILAVVSLYLVLGVGIDAVFAFSNTYALEEQQARGGRGGSGGWCGRLGSSSQVYAVEAWQWCGGGRSSM